MYRITLSEPAQNSLIFVDVTYCEPFPPHTKYTKREKSPIFVDWQLVEKMPNDLQPQFFLNLWLAFANGWVTAESRVSGCSEPADIILRTNPIAICAERYWFNYTSDKRLSPQKLLAETTPAETPPPNDLPF